MQMDSVEDAFVVHASQRRASAATNIPNRKHRVRIAGVLDRDPAWSHAGMPVNSWASLHELDQPNKLLLQLSPTLQVEGIPILDKLVQ